MSSFTPKIHPECKAEYESFVIRDPEKSSKKIGSAQVKTGRDSVFYTTYKRYFRSSAGDRVDQMSKSILGCFWTDFAKAKCNNTFNMSFDDARLNIIKTRTLNTLEQFEPKELAKLSWNLAKLDCEDAAFIENLKQTITKYNSPNLEDFGFTGVIKISRAFAKFGNVDENFNKPFEVSIKRYISRSGPTLSPKKFANAIHTLSKLDSKDLDFIYNSKDKIKECLLKNKNFFTPKALVKIACVFSQLRCEDNEFIDLLRVAIKSHLLEKQNFFNAKELVDIMYCFAGFDCQDKELFYALKVAIHNHLLNNPDQFTIQQLTELAIALATLGCDDVDFNNTLMVLIHKNLKTDYFSDVKNLVKVIWAFASLGFKGPDIVKILKDLITPHLPDLYLFTIKDLVTLAWSFAMFRPTDDTFNNQLMELLKPYIKNHYNFSNQDLVYMTWAFAVLGFKDPEIIHTLKELIAPSIQDPSSFSIYDLAKIVMAFSKFELNDDIDFLKNLNSCILGQQQKCKAFNNQECTVLNDAFSKLSEVNGNLTFNLLQSDVDEHFSSPEQTTAIVTEGNYSEFSTASSSSQSSVTESEKINAQLLSEGIQLNDFFNILEECFHLFDKSNVATFWHSIARNVMTNRWKVNFYERHFNTLKDRTLESLHHFNNKELANTTWALAQLGCTNSNFIDSLKEACKVRLMDHNSFEGEEFVSIVRAFAKFKISDPEFVNLLSRQIEDKLDTDDFLNVSQLTIMISGFSLLNGSEDFIIKLVRKKDLLEKQATKKMVQDFEMLKC